MRSRTFKLDEQSVVLPRGTRICLRTDVEGDDGYQHKAATVATVREVVGHTYHLETPSGRTLLAQRDQIIPQRLDLLENLGVRQWDFRRLESQVIYSAVVGSHAWGLANENSDEDVRGCFVAPFDDLSSLWDTPYEVHDPIGDAAYWEVERLIHQGLRGDANTLETLWSPLHREVTRLGRELLSRRDMFVSMNILGSFGRYAQSQFKKIERSQLRDNAVRAFLDDIDRALIDDVDGAARVLLRFGIAGKHAAARQEVHAVCRSLFDRGLIDGASFDNVVDAVREGRGEELVPTTYRPKNAYNLLRLLHSCIAWMETGQPLIEVRGELRDRLLEIKNQNVPIEKVVAEAKEVASRVDAAVADARLPESPDLECADKFLKMCRREAARRSFGFATPSAAATDGLPDETWAPQLTPVPLPADIHVADLHDFFADQLGRMQGGRVIWVGLTGSHTYGFPSPDSDLDLKGVHVLPAMRLLGMREPELSEDYLDEWRGREYDLTLNEIAKAARLVLAGNGNMLERLLGPMPLLTTPLGHQLARLAKTSLSKRVANHYRGFFQGMRREAELQHRNNALTAKTLLYGYRVALTGIHLLATGELFTDVRPLAQERGLTLVPELVDIKSNAEFQTVSNDLLASVEDDFHSLEAALLETVASSSLPSHPPNEAQLEDFVVRARLGASIQS